MNTVLDWLSGGDLRSDGAADMVPEVVLQHPALMSDLITGLDSPDAVTRGRTADALEKIARSRPDLTISHLPVLISLLKKGTVPMVRMHLAMMMGHFAEYSEYVDTIIPALLQALNETRVFAKSWAIVSLCIYARKYPRYRGETTKNIAELSTDPSKAIQTKVRYAMVILSNDEIPFPKGWVKSKRVLSD
jgi:hypothetical protein